MSSGIFYLDGMTVQQTNDGINFNRVGGDIVTIDIPNYNDYEIDFNAPDFHSYVVTNKIVGTPSPTYTSLLWQNVKEQPAPTWTYRTSMDAVTNGATTTVPGLGTVVHYMNGSDTAIANATIDGQHFLHPGIAIRYLYEKDGDYYITTIGFGNGPLPGPNTNAAEALWTMNAHGIGYETLYEYTYGDNNYRFIEGRQKPEGLDANASDTDVDYIDLIYQYFSSAKDSASPLVLDLDGNGIELSSLNSVNAVYWDLNSDGFAEATGWTSAGDGLLAIDLNNDGIINNNSELFGNSTNYANGFAALAVYDTNHDNQITADDSQFEEMLVWIDQNQDGYSEESELFTLTELSITSIATTWTDTNTTVSGNVIKQTSSFIIAGNTRTIADVWFNYSSVNTVYSEAYTADPRAAYAPTLRGYGALPDLHIAASIDNTGTGNLLDLVETFAGQTFAQIFNPTTTLGNDVWDIMFRWAGVDGVSPTSRGPFADARELGFLEKLMGQDFLQKGSHEDPYGPEAGYFISEAISLAFNNIFARLVAQSAGGELLEGDWIYNPVTDSFDGITGLNQTQLDALETEAAGLSNTGDRTVLWTNVLRMVEYTIGVSNLSGPEYTALNTAIEDSDSALDLATMLASLEYTLPASVTLNGSSSADTVTGGSGNNIINGLAGNDTLNGGAGDDTIYGGADNDAITGGTGGDYLIGGSGNDTYYYNVGDGNDTIRDTAGHYNEVEEIVFGSGISVGDLTLSRLGNNDLLIDIGGGTPGQILVEGHFALSGGVAYDRIETLRFSGGSTLDLTTQVYTTHGTSGNDTIAGIAWSGSTMDTIYGHGGDDTLSGGAANDTIYGGDGSDLMAGDDGADALYGGAGGDTIRGNAGDDSLTGGTGADYLQGGAGNDTYYYNVGDGIDTIKDGAGHYNETEEIVFGAGITSGDITLSRLGNNNLLIDIGGATPGQILVDGHFSVSGGVAYDRIETLRFSGGSTLDLTTQVYTTYGTAAGETIAGIVWSGSTTDTIYGYGGNDTITAAAGDDVVFGGDGNDVIYGGSGADTLHGEDGNDELYGGAGNDIYYYTVGADIISEGNDSPGGTDEIRLRDGIVLSDLTFSRSDTNAVISIAGGGSITIQNQFNGSSYIIETIRFFDNSTLTLSAQTYTAYGTSGNDTISGVTSGGSINDIIYGLDGNDTLAGGSGDDYLSGGNGNDSISGGSGNDILEGGAGDDTLDDGASYSGGGNDIYIYSGGLDTISEGSGGTDILRLTHSATISDLVITTYSTDGLRLTITPGVDVISLTYQRAVVNSGIETIEFSDGFKTTFTDYDNWIWGTSGGETLTGTAGHNTLIGKDGADVLWGAAGADDLHGGSGNDTLYGGDDADLLHGGTGDDILYGQSAADILWGGAGADTFMFQTINAFGGIDTIKDFSTAEGDKIDISDIIAGYDPLTDLLSDWVEITTSGSDSVLRVDRDGAGGTHTMLQIAKLENVTGLTDEAALVSNGNLII